MRVDVFGKKGTSKDGRAFMTYIGKLTRKDGEVVTCTIKFREEVGNPKKVPCTIEFDKKAANYSEKEVEYEKDGLMETAVRRTLWIQGDYAELEYVDTSMDDFE